MVPKFLLLFLCAIAGLVPFAQSKYGYTTGLDTTALKFGLKSKTQFTINIHDGITDTVLSSSVSYYPNGFIATQKEERGSVTFKYNDDGYLTGEDYHDIFWNGSGTQIKGPVANPSGDTSYVSERSSTMNFGSTERTLEESFCYVGDHEKSESKRIYDYDSLGRISFHVHLSINNGDTTTVKYNHFYLEKNPMLVSKIESSDKTIEALYFYNQDELLVEWYSKEKGSIYSRNIRVYQYYQE